PVPPQPQGDLARQLARALLVRSGRRRAEHERPGAGDVAAHVRVRPAHVADEEILVVQMLGEPGRVDDGAWDSAHSAATIPASLATAGRCSSRASQSVSAGKVTSSTPSM